MDDVHVDQFMIMMGKLIAAIDRNTEAIKAQRPNITVRPNNPHPEIPPLPRPYPRPYWRVGEAEARD